MQLTEINLVVTDLGRSHAFYTALGWTMRAITFPGDEEPQAWFTENGPAPIGLHTVSFTGGWDPSGPEAVPGSITVDLTFDGADEAAAFLAVAVAAGGVVLSESRPMPWGQNYALVTDPDGYRWGLKSPLSD